MGDTCTKAVIIVVNTLFLIFGIAILVLGILFKVNWDDVKDAFAEEGDVDIKGTGEMLSLVAIIFGSFIVILALCGCIGAWCRNKCMLGTYGFVVAVLLIAQIACVIAVSINAFDIEDKLEDVFTKSLKGFKEDLSDDKSNSWGHVFGWLDCCGVNDPKQDFMNNSFTQSSDRESDQTAPFPVACCKEFDIDSDKVNAALFKNEEIAKCMKETTDTYYSKGCEEKFKDIWKDNKAVMIGVGVAVFVVQFFLIIMSCYLMRKNDD